MTVTADGLCGSCAGASSAPFCFSVYCVIIIVAGFAKVSPFAIIKPKLPRNSSVLTFSLSGFAGICC